MILIEKMARAIGEVYDGYADPVDTPSNYGRAKSATIAALKAMREPSEAMMKAGVTAFVQFNSDYATKQEAVADILQAVIDAAIKEAEGE